MEGVSAISTGRHEEGSAVAAAVHTRTLLLALHLAGPLGRPRPQILLRTASIAEPGCRLPDNTGTNKEMEGV